MEFAWRSRNQNEIRWFFQQMPSILIGNICIAMIHALLQDFNVSCNIHVTYLLHVGNWNRVVRKPER